MPAVHRGEVWVVDFGIAAKVRPALLLTDSPAVDELDLVTTLPHTTSLRGKPLGVGDRQAISQTRRVSPAADIKCSHRETGTATWCVERRRNETRPRGSSPKT
jgi:hypothetical protein